LGVLPAVKLLGSEGGGVIHGRAERLKESLQVSAAGELIDEAGDCDAVLRNGLGGGGGGDLVEGLQACCRAASERGLDGERQKHIPGVMVVAHEAAVASDDIPEEGLGAERTGEREIGLLKVEAGWTAATWSATSTGREKERVRA
jgi:hypothetical protein